MAVEQHKKVDIALAQLEAAIRLFFYGREYVAALTLAGAAEEIYGRMLQALGKESALYSYARSYSLLMKAFENQELDEREIRRQRNAARNSVKHFDTFSDLTVVFDEREEAIQMISHAITNYKSLHLPITEELERFEKWQDEHE